MNPTWVPFSEPEMFENISEFRGSGFRETVAGSRESPALSSSIVMHSPTRPSPSYNVDVGVGGGSGGLEAGISKSSRRISRERRRLQWVATESAEKVTGLKRKVDELSSEVVLARVGQECSQEEVVVLESKFEAATDLLGPLEAENVNLKKNMNKAYVRECRTRKETVESDGEDDAYKSLASKEAYITKCVDATMNKMLPRTGAKKKAKFLTKMISDGKIFGSDGKGG